MSSAPVTRRLAAASRLAVAGLLVAACSGTAATPSPTAAPTAAPTPSPSPTPSASVGDISAAFLKIISAPDFSAKEAVTGKVKVGPNEGTVTGSGVMTGGDSNEQQTIKVGSSTVTTLKTDIGTKSWSKTEPGPWLEDPKPAKPEKDFSDFLHSIKAMKDLGLEARPGRKLHHLQPSDGNAIPAEYVGFASGEGAKDPEFTVDFYATDDGTPVTLVLAGTWTIVNGATETPASISYDDTLSEVGKPHKIVPPDEVWVRYTSALGYSMGHPADWTVATAKTEDTYSLKGQGRVYVSTIAYTGTVAAYANALKATYQTQLGRLPRSSIQKVLGGGPAVRLTYDYTDANGQKGTIVDDVTVHDGKGYEVFLVAPGATQADLDTFDAFSSTFAFPK